MHINTRRAIKHNVAGWDVAPGRRDAPAFDGCLPQRFNRPCYWQRETPMCTGAVLSWAELLNWANLSFLPSYSWSYALTKKQLGAYGRHRRHDAQLLGLFLSVQTASPPMRPSCRGARLFSVEGNFLSIRTINTAGASSAQWPNGENVHFKVLLIIRDN